VQFIDYVSEAIAEGNYSGTSTFISGTTVYSPTIAGTNGKFTGSVTVGDGGNIVIDGVNSKIYLGTGVYNNTNTEFYVDNAGQFSLGDKFTWDGTSLNITGSGTFSGTINASDGVFTGAVTVASGSSMAFGKGVSGANDGLKITDNDYIYDTGAFSFGGGALTGTASSLAIDTDDFNLASTNITLTSNSGGSFAVGTVLTADGATNTGTFAGWSFSEDALYKNSLFLSSVTDSTGLYLEDANENKVMQVGDFPLLSTTETNLFSNLNYVEDWDISGSVVSINEDFTDKNISFYAVSKAENDAYGDFARGKITISYGTLEPGQSANFSGVASQPDLVGNTGGQIGLEDRISEVSVTFRDSTGTLSGYPKTYKSLSQYAIYGQTHKINEVFNNATASNKTNVSIDIEFKIYHNGASGENHNLVNISSTITRPRVSLTKDQFLLYVDPKNYLEWTSSKLEMKGGSLETTELDTGNAIVRGDLLVEGNTTISGEMATHPTIAQSSNITALTGGSVIESLTFDGFGHVTDFSTRDLDGRYINATGDTMTGDLIFSNHSGGIYFGESSGDAIGYIKGSGLPGQIAIGSDNLITFYETDNGSQKAQFNLNDSIFDFSGNITLTGTVDGRDIANDGTKLDSLYTTIGLSALTAGEVNQLEAIGSTTISSTQWGYLGALNQNLTTSSSPTFNSLTLTQPDGTAPLTITSKAVVANLNADLLDGYQAQAFKNNTHTTHTAQNVAVGWYTIATNTGSRAVARFGIRDTNSSDHQTVVFYASHHYGSGSDITVLHTGVYSGSPFRHIRIRTGGTYDGALLQIYIDDSTNNVDAYLLGDNFQDDGWVLKDWVADGVDPGDVTFAALTNVAAQIDLNQELSGGIITTGNIYSGGSTTQYKVWNTGNDGSGSGLDADVLDGLQSTSFLRSDADDSFTGTITGYELWLGGSAIMSSPSASLQVNGFMHTGTIHLHEGGSTPSTTNKALDNNSGSLEWDSQTVWHSGNDGSDSTLDADLWDGNEFADYLNQAVLSTSTVTFAVVNTPNLDAYAPNGTRVHWDVRDEGAEGSRLHRYNRSSDDNTYEPYYEHWYDGSSYHSIGIEGSIWRLSSGLTISGPVVATTVNTGQGANELYAMDQAVRTTDSPEFASQQLGDTGLRIGTSPSLFLDKQATSFRIIGAGSNNDSYPIEVNRSGVLTQIRGTLEVDEDAAFAGALTISGNLTAQTNLYIGDTGAYFFNDSGTRIKTNHDFWVNNSNTYLYGDTVYLGSTSGDSITLRGNTISANSWSFTGAGALTIDRDGQTGDAIVIDHVEDQDWPFKFSSSSVGNDNSSGFWVNSDGSPDMRLRYNDATVKTLISSNAHSYFMGGNVGIGTETPTVPFEVIGDTNIAGTLTVTGDFDVSGTFNRLNAEELLVEDKLITVNSSGTDATSDGAGIVVDRPSGNASLLWDNNTSRFTLSHGLTFLTGDAADTLDLSNGDIIGINELIFNDLGEGLVYPGDFELYVSNTNLWTFEGGDLTTSDNILLNNILLSGGAVSVGVESKVVAECSTTLYDGVFFDYVIVNGLNKRTGTVMATHDGTLVEYNEASTGDLGNTQDVILSVDINSGKIRLIATSVSTGWSVKTFTRGL